MGFGGLQASARDLRPMWFHYMLILKKMKPYASDVRKAAILGCQRIETIRCGLGNDPEIHEYTNYLVKQYFPKYGWFATLGIYATLNGQPWGEGIGCLLKKEKKGWRLVAYSDCDIFSYAQLGVLGIPKEVAKALGWGY